MEAFGNRSGALWNLPAFQHLVGFTNSSLAAVGWIRIDLYAQFARAGALAVEYALDPQFLTEARERWDAWFEGLGSEDRWAGGPHGTPPGGFGAGMYYGDLPGAGEHLPDDSRRRHLQASGGGVAGGGVAGGGVAGGGVDAAAKKLRRWSHLPAGRSVEAATGVLSKGWHDCPKWGLLATEQAFLEGVGRACLFTPIFTMAMTLPFLRSASMAYLVLVTLLMMVVTTLGALRLLGIPLGAVEALALSLVMGVSVDYIIHIACTRTTEPAH